uniref:Uncharacterized protein n=1 Tax=viral metagenome TaxID=1070528 RepID=A0A6C0JTK9_9ZZZZ
MDIPSIDDFLIKNAFYVPKNYGKMTFMIIFIVIIVFLTFTIIYKKYKANDKESQQI